MCVCAEKTSQNKGQLKKWYCLNAFCCFIHFQKTQEEWRLVFYICAGIALLGAIVFGLFAQTDEEPWAKETTKDISLPSKETSKEAHTYDNKALDPDDEPEKTVYNIEL